MPNLLSRKNPWLNIIGKPTNARFCSCEDRIDEAYIVTLVTFSAKDDPVRFRMAQGKQVVMTEVEESVPAVPGNPRFVSG